VRDYARTMPQVELEGNNLAPCPQDTQKPIKERIKSRGLNRVVAFCTPRPREPTFQETIKAAWLNRYRFHRANLRYRGSWLHQNETEAATCRAKDQVPMAGATVGWQPSVP
jgi:heterodisulfide reductase subunit A-like polyferredoxin